MKPRRGTMNRRKRVCVMTSDGIVPVSRCRAAFLFIGLPILIGCVLLGAVALFHPAIGGVL